MAAVPGGRSRAMQQPYSQSRNKRFPEKPKRLDAIFAKYDSPLFFVTFNTMHRQRLLALDEVHLAFKEYVTNAIEHDILVGKYVIMPDHIHLFVRGSDSFDLGLWIRGLKRVISKAIQVSSSEHWQPAFFDHMLRSDESYSEKWEYVKENSVRKGYVKTSGDWPYQGEINVIDRV